MKIDDDDFTLFGLPRRHALDRAELDARWRALQSEVHPDRHAAAGDAARRVAMQWAVRVNQGYKRLQDPLTRAAYLCELAGAPTEAESNTSMPADFLMQQLDWREALDDAGDAAAVALLLRQVDDAERRLLDETADALDRRGDAAAAAAKVRALMFVRRFRDEIERRLEHLDA